MNKLITDPEEFKKLTFNKIIRWGSLTGYRTIVNSDRPVYERCLFVTGIDDWRGGGQDTSIVGYSFDNHNIYPLRKGSSNWIINDGLDINNEVHLPHYAWRIIDSTKIKTHFKNLYSQYLNSQFSEIRELVLDGRLKFDRNGHIKFNGDF